MLFHLPIVWRKAIRDSVSYDPIVVKINDFWWAFSGRFLGNPSMLIYVCAFSRITYVVLSVYFSIFYILLGFSGNKYDFYLNPWVNTEKGVDFRKITSSSCKDVSPDFRNVRCTKKPCFFQHPYLKFNFSADLNIYEQVFSNILLSNLNLFLITR